MSCINKERHDYSGAKGICTGCGLTEKQIASNNTKLWIKNNPERTRKNLEISKKRKEDRLKLSVKALKKSKYKTPDSAIRAYCRLYCQDSHSDRPTFLNSQVECTDTNCPLFPFTYGNVNQILRGKKENNIKNYHHNRLDKLRKA